MTDEQLAAIRARCEAATPGAWIVQWSNHEKYPNIVVYPQHYYPECVREPADPDMRLIFHARNDIGILLAEVDRLRGLLGSAS